MLRDLRQALRKAGDPAKSQAMRAYMKSTMPYHGVPTPAQRRIFMARMSRLHFADAASWQAQVLFLWHNAKFREERYAALYLAGHKAAVAFQTPAAMSTYEEMIVSGAWWDYVDDIASHRVGPILRAYPAPMRRKLLAWSKSDHLWKRRTAIISQLGFKGATDLQLLYACIEPSLDSREFFLRKAIGWALRQYAWIDAREIKRYVRLNRNRLSPLSVREALKNIVRVTD